MPSYSILGVTLRTNRPLPGAFQPVTSDVADVEIELAGMDEESSMPASALATVATQQAPFEWIVDAGVPYLRVRYAGEGHEAVFLLEQGGRRMWVRWNAFVGLEDIAALLTGPMLVCLLRLRGLTCLHGCVLDLGDRAIALLGAKGAGKTSTAMALVQQGARLMSDDVAVLDPRAGGCDVRRGPARLRLRPEPAAALGERFDRLDALWSREDQRPRKRSLALPDEGTALAPVMPLAAIYVLGARTPDIAPRIVPLTSGSVLPLLMAHRHMAEATGKAGVALDFQRLASLGAVIPVRAVERPEGVEHVHDIAGVIWGDVRQ